MKKIIFSTLLAASMSAGAVCNNTTIKGNYETVVYNTDGTYLTGTFNFTGIINVIPLVGIYSTYSLSMKFNGLPVSGSGFYGMDSQCRLTGSGSYTYQGVKHNTTLSTGSFVVVNGRARTGEGLLNASRITFKAK